MTYEFKIDQFALQHRQSINFFNDSGAFVDQVYNLLN